MEMRRMCKCLDQMISIRDHYPRRSADYPNLRDPASSNWDWSNSDSVEMIKDPDGIPYDAHFGLLKNPVPGNEVLFTDVEGNEFRYTVTELETLAGTVVEEMESGAWDLTLFTCTLGGQMRVTVRVRFKAFLYSQTKRR